MGAKPSRVGYHIVREAIRARGHEHIRAEHVSTFEVTTDDWLASAGDCIIDVEAERMSVDLDPAFVEVYQSRDAAIGMHVRVDASDETHEQIVHIYGCPDLMFEGDRNIVFHTNGYVDDQTGEVSTVHAAVSFGRNLALTLADGVELTVTIEVE